MDQTRVKALLDKAVKCVKTKDETKVLEELLKAMSPDFRKPLCEEQALYQLVTELYWKTLFENPDYLPKLFPIYALLCGDKPTPTSLLSDSIDWTLVEEM